MKEISIEKTLRDYLQTVELSRSANTARTYRNAINAFRSCMQDSGQKLNQMSPRDVQEDWIADFAAVLKRYSPASERLYLTAANGWYEYLAAEALSDVNLPRVRLLIRRRGRRPGQRLPQFPREAIEQILDYAQRLGAIPVDDARQKLRNLRDRALLLTLADTGMRVHEACNLRRGDVDWNEGRAILIGKGDREAVVRFSKRSLRSLRDYFSLRSNLDGSSGRPLASLPLFARHDKRAGNRVLPISTTTARSIVRQRSDESVNDEHQGTITPHSFRHYFVTTVLRGSGGNLKLAQELARHQNIAVTQRYAHLSDDELDRGYYEIFEDG
jgi:site-specific recombinase XerD